MTPLSRIASSALRRCCLSLLLALPGLACAVTAETPSSLPLGSTETPPVATVPILPAPGMPGGVVPALPLEHLPTVPAAVVPGAPVVPLPMPAPPAAELPTVPATPVPPGPTAPRLAHRPKIGLVLGGGGARGVSEVGVLQALEELHVPVDVVVGTSMGSIVAGAYAMGVSPAEMERRLQTVNWDEVVSDQVPRSQRSELSKEQERQNIRAVELGFSGGRVRLPRGAVAGHEFELFLTSLLGSAPFFHSFDQLPIPFRAVATDIETGEMVVLDRGDLVGSIRASMAVPGVFNPVEIDGRLLVDGGLTRNLPVDVARAMGAEQLIVVEVGTPLMKRNQITSVIAVSQQMLNILGHQNVAASEQQLREGDVMIRVALGEFSVADFDHAPATIVNGRNSALLKTSALEPLRVSDAEWRSWHAARMARRDVPADRWKLRIDASQLGNVNPRSVQALMDSHEGALINQSTLDRDIRRLYATDDFQQIRARLIDEPDGSQSISVQPIEKEWGPNYVNLDIDLSTDLQGNSRFTARAASRSTWLNSRGLEWRNAFSLGAINEWASELYQPLDFSRTLFVAPRLELHQERDDLYQQDTPVTTYRINRRLFGIDAGNRFGTSSQLRVGFESGGVNATPEIEQTVFPNLTQRLGDVHLRLDADTLDRWAFPSEGEYLHLEWKDALEGLGSTTHYDRGEVQFEHAMHAGNQDFRLGLSGGSNFGTVLPVTDLFPLGGFLQLSGYAQRQFLGQRYLLGRLITYHTLGDPGAYTRRLFLGASLEAGNVYDRFNGTNSSGLRHSGSVFVGADTGIGPLYLGLGVAGNSRSAYLFLGRP